VGRALKEKYGSRVFTVYQGHEENVLTNLTRTSIIANWVQTRKPDFHPNVATYLHYYRGGLVADLGVMGSDVIMSDGSVQFLLSQTLLFTAEFDSGVTNPPSLPATTTNMSEQSSVGAAYRPSPVGNVVVMSLGDRMVMPLLLVGMILLVSFLAAAVLLRRREHRAV